MEAFGIIGMSLGTMGFIFSMAALTKTILERSPTSTG